MNLNLHLLAFCLFLGIAAADHVEVEPNAGDPELLARYPNFLVLISNTYELYWKYTAGTSRLDIAVRARTTGWVGFGVSERGNMVNADIAVGWVTDQGEVNLEDRYSGDDGFPPEDTRNDLNLIRGGEDHGWTTLEFWRLLDTGDSGVTGNFNHDRIITEGNTAVIFAHGETDDFSYHMTQRGAVGVYLLGGDSKSNVEDGAKTVRVTVKNITIPSADTTYWCAGFRLPQEMRSSVKHLIKFAPILHGPATPHVHHMVLYTCDDVKFHNVTDEALVGGQCFTNPPSPWASCFRGNGFAAWAVGGKPFIFPDDTSFSMGGPNGSEYLMLQLHYDNPNMISGVSDFSGFELTYLDIPRKYDTGVMTVGYTVGLLQIVPPHQDNFDIYGICNSSCTSQNIPTEGINVFANFLHTHLAGRGLVLRQYRDNVEVTPPIDQDLNYDFNFQQVRTIPTRKIYPGDRLELMCKYQSIDRNSTVFGGLSTREEMCLSYFFYYPRIALKSCLSVIKRDKITSALSLQDNIPRGTLYGMLSNPNFPWNELDRVQNLQDVYRNFTANSSYFDARCVSNDAILLSFDRPSENGTNGSSFDRPTENGTSGSSFDRPTENGTSGSRGLHTPLLLSVLMMVGFAVVAATTLG